MQIVPVRYDSVIEECGFALEAKPGFGRALFRRARAYEALGELELAMQDIQVLLEGDGNHEEAMEVAARLRLAMNENREQAQPDLQGNSAALASSSSHAFANSPSPALEIMNSVLEEGRPLQESRCSPDAAMELPDHQKGDGLEHAICDYAQNFGSSIPAMQETPRPQSPKSSDCHTLAQTEISSNNSLQFRKPISIVTQPPKSRDRIGRGSSEKASTQQNGALPSKVQSPASTLPNTRLIKLIYDHDIRRVQIPVNCKFIYLRELVRKTFPLSKSVLIKYKDMEGDLVTITNTKELRLAEAATTMEAVRKRIHTQSNCLASQDEHGKSNLEPLRLYVVDVPADQEPRIQDREFRKKQFTADASTKAATDSSIKAPMTEKVQEGKQRQIDQWLLDFASLFSSHLGIDAEGHIFEINDVGMELCCEALQENARDEEDAHLFELAACKFQEVAALAFLNWGNVHMCAARKRHKGDITHEDLQAAFDWAHGQYLLAATKFDEALRVKPNLYEAILALGQLNFEIAKLRWALAVAGHVDLGRWDSSEILALFRNAQEKTQLAAEMLEMLEEQRISEANRSIPEGSNVVRSGRGLQITQADMEQLAALKDGINLFWGKVLFEHSQVEFKLGLHSWKELLDQAVQRFELAGTSPSDIEAFLSKSHLSNSSGLSDLRGHTDKICEHTSVPQDEALQGQENGELCARLTTNVEVEQKVFNENHVLEGDTPLDTRMGNGFSTEGMMI